MAEETMSVDQADQALGTADNSWDVKDLLQKLEKAGLPVLETGAMKVLDSVFEWVQESVVKTDNKYDDMILSFLPAIRAYALRMADKIASADVKENKDLLGQAQAEAQEVASNHPITQMPMA